jgi:hypothetical protein
MNRSFISRFLSFSLIILFLGYYGSITLFYHVHIIDNQIFVHSHPYKNSNSDKSPVQSHSHSALMLHHIQELNESGWEDIIFSLNNLIHNNFNYSEILTSSQTEYLFHSISITSLRAPPVFG